jgi:hypothetical protein
LSTTTSLRLPSRIVGLGNSSTSNLSQLESIISTGDKLMEHGVLCLKRLYEFVDGCSRTVENHNGMLVPSAYLLKSGDLGGRYCKQCESILPKPPDAVVVPEQGGFYLWGFYNHNKFWVNVYLGMATEGKTANLRARLYEELTNERAFV